MNSSSLIIIQIIIYTVSKWLILRYVFAADMVRRGREEGLLLDLESGTEMLSKAQVGMLPFNLSMEAIKCNVCGDYSL